MHFKITAFKYYTGTSIIYQYNETGIQMLWKTATTACVFTTALSLHTDVNKIRQISQHSVVRALLSA